MARMSELPRTSFIDLMELSDIEERNEKDVNIYVSRLPAFNPGLGSAFGGHVFAQSVWAASQTVDKGMVVHNVHGYFTLPGFVNRPYVYTVTHISAGRSYCTRNVVVQQPTSPSSLASDGRLDPRDAEKELGRICFTSICSFKRDEKSNSDHQARIDLEGRYSLVLKGKKPDEHSQHPRLDTPWYHRYRERYGQTNDFPGLDMRRVDMSAFNESAVNNKSPIDYRQLSFYSLIGHIPSDDFNLHACAHLYASDRNSLYLVSNAAGFGDQVNVMGSLSHSVVFHVSSKDLVLRGGEWWCQESWSSRSGGGRGMVESRIIGKDGLHVASTWQDGLVRKAEREIDQKQKMGWFEGVKRRGMPLSTARGTKL